MTQALEESSLPGRPGFLLQTLMAGPVLFVVILMWFMQASASYDGGLSAIAWILGGAYYSVITVCIVTVVGLPLRNRLRPRAWLVQRWWIPLTGIALGLVLVALGSLRASDVTAIDATGYREYVDGPNLPLSLLGWFMLAFCLMHTWWPARGSRARRAVTPA